MYKSLSSGIKISITRSISTSFEMYLASIEWDEERYLIEDFIAYWKKYSTENAAWMEKVPEEVRISQEFNEEVASKINEVIEKILNDGPTEQQVQTIEALQSELGTNYSYGCKAEAHYVEQQLLKLKQSE